MSKLTNINTDLTGRILHPTDVNYDGKRYLYYVCIPEGKHAVAYYDINEVAKIGKHLSFIVKPSGSNITSTTGNLLLSFGIEPAIKSISDEGIVRVGQRENECNNVNYVEFTTERFCNGNNMFGTNFVNSITSVGIAHIKTENGADTKTILVSSNITDKTIKSYGIKYAGFSFNSASSFASNLIFSSIPLKIQIIDSVS